MLKIKTITTAEPAEFDELVNAAIADGWDLVKRDVLPPFEGDAWFYKRTFYAELEREEEEPEEEEVQDDFFAEWVLTRDPVKPFKCSFCGHRPTPGNLPKSCPQCGKVIFDRGGVQ